MIAQETLTRIKADVEQYGMDGLSIWDVNELIAAAECDLNHHEREERVAYERCP